jgi:hypothetical protein
MLAHRRIPRTRDPDVASYACEFIHKHRLALSLEQWAKLPQKMRSSRPGVLPDPPERLTASASDVAFSVHLSWSVPVTTWAALLSTFRTCAVGSPAPSAVSPIDHFRNLICVNLTQAPQPVAAERERRGARKVASDCDAQESRGFDPIASSRASARKPLVTSSAAHMIGPTRTSAPGGMACSNCSTAFRIASARGCR